MRPVIAVSCLAAYSIYRLIKYQNSLDAYEKTHQETNLKIQKIREETYLAHQEHLKRMQKVK
jgi:hypothetical protein